jgi:histidinol-phosphate aminotransferase
VTQAVARVALAHAHELLAKVEAIRIDRDQITQWLRDHGLVVPDSDANFVLVGRFADRHAVWRGLLNRGVLVRETGPEGYLRVTVGTPDEMASFRSAIVEVMG